MKELDKLDLFGSVKKLIEDSRRNIALAVNAEITFLHYQVGKRINQEILRDSRAEYG